MELFFCGLTYCFRGAGVIILLGGKSTIDAVGGAVEIDACFNAVVADVADVLRAAARAEVAAAAVAISSRRKSFRTCFAAFLFLIMELEKGDMLSGGGIGVVYYYVRQ